MSKTIHDNEKVLFSFGFHFFFFFSSNPNELSKKNILIVILAQLKSVVLFKHANYYITD